MSYGIGGTGAEEEQTGAANFSVNGVVGVRGDRAPANDAPLPTGMSSLNGEMFLFKKAEVIEEGDAAEAYVKETSNGQLRVGSWMSIPFPSTGGTVFEAGSYDDSPDPTAIDVGDAIGEVFSLFGLPAPTISGSLTALPTAIQSQRYPSDTETVYVFTLNPATQNRIHWGYDDDRGTRYSMQIGLASFLVPEFTPCLPDSAKPTAALENGLGEVELTMQNGELVRVHMGRGQTDQNQQAWLGVRQDGFGPLVFHGSPTEFELLYEDDPESYEDAPLNGRTFDVADDFTETQKTQSGWSSRFAYMQGWFSPRLKQVKGGDVLVTIQHQSSYCKVLKFYWATEAGALSGRFYNPAGQPFKTIVLSNPTAPSNAAGLPTEKYHLRVVEDGTRYHEIRAPESFYSGTFSFKTGPTADAGDWQRDIVVSAELPWQITESRLGQSVTITEDYGPDGRSPLSTERPELYARTETIGGVSRTVTAAWEEVVDENEYWLYSWLRQVDWSGDTTWAAKGAQMVFDQVGWTSSEKSIVGGKTSLVNHAWNGNIHTATAKLDGTTYQTTVSTYSAGFAQVGVTQGGVTTATLTYHAPSATDGIPETLKEVSYPGGYKETYSVSTAGIYTTSTVKTGWGTALTAGMTTTVKTDQLGGVVDWEVKANEGVTLARETGSNPTAWGAPKTITSLRGGVSHRTYQESGLALGAVATATDAYGVAASMGAPDWLLRPASFNTGFENLTFNYTNPLKVTATSNAGHVDETTVSAFGDFRAASSTFGTHSSVSINPGGSSTLTTDNRTVTLSVDGSGVLSTIGNGAGSRGAEYDFGVENGLLYTMATEKKKSGALSANVMKTFYDQKGRVKKIERPAADGSTATEVWTYDDASRSVTYAPGVGPVAQSTITALSANGTVRTVTKGGHDFLRETRSVANGSVIFVTEFNNDTSGGATAWTEMSRRAVNPAAGTVTVTPWSLAANATTLTETAPGAQTTRTITNGLTGDSVTTTLQGGVPSAVNGTFNGVAVALNVTAAHGLVTAVGGTVGGLATGLKIGDDRRLSEVTSPGSKQAFTYANVLGGGAQVSMQDTLQGTSGSFTADATGDATSLQSPNALALTLGTVDTAGGSRTTVNGGLQIDTNLLGGATAKNYTAGLNEGFTLSPDGSLASWNVQSGGGSLSATITQTPAKRTAAYVNDVTIVENFYDTGPRSGVNTTGDARSFTYERLAMKEETHTAGPWAGWKIERVPDARGRLWKLRVKKEDGSTVREFTLGYDTSSRLDSSVTPQLSATYGARTAKGQFSTLTRGTVGTSWSFGGTGLLQSVTNSNPGGTAFNYSFTDYDARRRHENRLASDGVSWTGMGYDGSQLAAAHLSTGRDAAYGYDARGNRNAQGAEAAQTPNGLDQITTRTLASRGFGLLGSVDKDAKVLVSTPLAPGWQQMTVDPVTGGFFGWWNVPAGYNGGAAARIAPRVRGVLPSTVPGGHPAIADATIELVVPPMAETLTYDGGGRLGADAFWTYTWDGPGRLKTMTRKAGTYAKASVQSEAVTFGYDADGRRTSKTHTTTYGTGTSQVTHTEVSTVLWAGCLEVLEQRTKDGVNLGRRWFQRGADLSGTLDGAGGIGGLVAIIEEDAAGVVKRTLLPVHDGLGNITAVLDKATGQTVARYEFGPFGEPLGESGEVDACPFRWQTKWHDAESQHYYFLYRYYDPRLGRWLSRDPLGEAGGFNLYSYCGNDPVNGHDPLGLADRPIRPYGLLQLMWPATTGRDDLMGVAREGGLYGAYGILSTPGKIAAHPKVQGSLRMAGGGLEVGVGAVYSFGTDGIGAALGGVALMANGADNFNAGLQTFRLDAYQPAFLERGITSVAGNGLLGNGLYAATQLGVGFAPAIGTRATRFASSLDWEPVFAPYRGGYAYSGVPLPGMPRYRGPSSVVGQPLFAPSKVDVFLDARIAAIPENERLFLIGENQFRRVNPAARRIGAKTATDFWPDNMIFPRPLNAEQTAASIEFNQYLVQRLHQAGFSFGDIGPMGIEITSPWYRAELQTLDRLGAYPWPVLE